MTAAEIREIYKQLKNVCIKQNDKPQELKFYELEMSSYKKELDEENGEFGDKFIVCTNTLSNRHGLSIRRPFALFLAFSIGFYILYLLSLGRIFNSNSIDLDLIGYYFSFIDLTHRNDFLVDKTEFNGLSLALDYTSKVFSGYFIYQFIAAFRKYGKH